MAYWYTERLVLHNYATRQQALGSPFAVQVLDSLRSWRSIEELQAKLPGIPKRMLRKVVERLSREGLVETSSRGRVSSPSLASWGNWDPVASFFHFSTKDQARAEGPVLERLEEEFSRQSSVLPPPPPVKRHAGAPLVDLPKRERAGEFVDVLLDRRTWRGFSKQPLPAEDLATLLDLTFGIRFWGEVSPRDPVGFRTSPSSGGRQTIEAYVLALRVAGLPRGLYHYAADVNKLERLREGASRRELQAYLCGQWWYRPAAAVVFMTAVLPRIRWRYDFPRVYRSVLLETGHFCQTFLLVATWLKLAPFCTAALADTRLERALGADGTDEVVLYAAGVGMRPPGCATWVQWPDES